MAEDEVQYEFKSVKAIRGTEARTIAKWEELGWELDTQTPGTLRTDLTFRRMKKQMPKALLAGIIGFFALVIIGGIAAGIAGGGDDDFKPTASTIKASSSAVPSETPSESMPTPEETTAAPSPSKSVPAGPVTAANNAEFAALLKLGDYCDKSIGAFAGKYEGQFIQFDGVIANQMPHGNNTTRYDILLSPGNKANTPFGPAFKYENLNTVFDLHWTGSNTPDYVGVGSKLRFTAEVGEFKSNQCLFFLTPVSTEAR